MVKARKPNKTRSIPFHMVKAGTMCVVDGQKVLKVRTKTAMTEQGKVLRLADATVVKVAT